MWTKIIIYALASILVNAEEKPAQPECTHELDPNTSPDQYLLDLEIQKTQEALEYYEMRAKELEETIANNSNPDN